MSSSPWIQDVREAIDHLSHPFGSVESVAECAIVMDVIACGFVHLEFPEPERIIEDEAPSLGEVLEMLPHVRRVSVDVVEAAYSLERESTRVEYKLGLDADPRVNLVEMNKLRDLLVRVCGELLGKHSGES